MQSFNKYKTVREASEILGVSVMTLHRWDAKGKLKSFRHPINNYRLYKEEELMSLLSAVSKAKNE